MRRSAGGYLRAQLLIMSLIMLLCTLESGLPGFWGIPSRRESVSGFWTPFRFLAPGQPLFLDSDSGGIPERLQGGLILALTYGSCVLLRELLEPRLVGNRLGFFRF